MSEQAPTSLSDELAARNREIDSLKERLRASESEAGKVGSLQREHENLNKQLTKERQAKDNANAKVAELEWKVADLQSSVYSSDEDKERISALESALADKDSEIENLKSDFQKQATEHNTVQEQLNVATGELERLGAVDAAAKQLMDALEKLGNTD